MKLYVLSMNDPSKIKRISRILRKHGIRYSALIIVVADEDKARALGGIISKYGLQKLTLEDILFYLTPP